MNNNPSSTPYLDLRGIEYETKQEYHATAPQTARSISTVSTVHGTPRSYGLNGFRNDRTDIQNEYIEIPHLDDFVGKVSSLDSDSSNISNNNNNINNDNNNNKNFHKNKSSPEKKNKKSPNKEKKKNENNFDDMNDTIGIKNRPDSPLLLPLSSAMINNPIRDRNDDNKNKSDDNNNSSDINIRFNSNDNQGYDNIKSEHSIRSPSKNVLTTSKNKDMSVADDNEVKRKGKDDDKDTTKESEFQKHCSVRSKSQFTSKDVENGIQYGSISDFDVDALLRKNMYVQIKHIFFEELFL